MKACPGLHTVAYFSWTFKLKATLYLWQPKHFNLYGQRNALVFSGTPNLACKAKKGALP